MEMQSADGGNSTFKSAAGENKQPQIQEVHIEQANVCSQDLAAHHLPKVASPLSLYDVLGIPEAKQLDEALASKGKSPVLLNLGLPENTERFMRASLRGSYLFGREVVPSYAAHVFASLRTQTPPGEEIGHVIRGITGMCIGELCTNNVYRRPGECHSHFHDMLEAYKEAGCNVDEFQTFLTAAAGRGTLSGIQENSELWSTGSKKYAEKLLAVCADPLASFILMPCNEILTTIIYPVAIAHMTNESRFDKFRHFLEVHVELDGDDHGCVALEWLALYKEKAKVSQEELATATKKVLALFQSE